MHLLATQQAMLGSDFDFFQHGRPAAEKVGDNITVGQRIEARTPIAKRARQCCLQSITGRTEGLPIRRIPRNVLALLKREARGHKPVLHTLWSQVEQGGVVQSRHKEVVQHLGRVLFRKSLGGFCLDNDAAVHQEIRVVVFAEVIKRKRHLQLARHLESAGQETLSQFCLIEPLVHITAKLIVDLEGLACHHFVDGVERFLVEKGDGN